jgi:palmitoyltransferase
LTRVCTNLTLGTARINDDSDTERAYKLTHIYRECLAKNVEIWLRLKNIFDLALRSLFKRSLRDSRSENAVSDDLDILQTTDLILKNYETLVDDLHCLNNLLVITRNMLAVKETAQEICARVNFDKTVHELIILCINVTSKGCDGENVDEVKRGKVNNITELCESSS